MPYPDKFRAKAYSSYLSGPSYRGPVLGVWPVALNWVFWSIATVLIAFVLSMWSRVHVASVEVDAHNISGAHVRATLKSVANMPLSVGDKVTLTVSDALDRCYCSVLSTMTVEHEGSVVLDCTTSCSIGEHPVKSTIAYKYRIIHLFRFGSKQS
jgi:hypothetical protein